jgi:hypothetical protein
LSYVIDRVNYKEICIKEIDDDEEVNVFFDVRWRGIEGGSKG